MNKISNLIILVILISYTAISLLFFNKNSVFLISYIFTIISFVIGIYLNTNIFNDKGISYFNNLPLGAIYLIYLIIQIFVSLICMNLPVIFISYVLSIQIIILSIFIVIMLLLLKSKDYIKYNEETKKNQTFISSIQKEIEVIYNINDNYKENMSELKDLIRYSNPVSNNEVKSLENNIIKNINQLKENITGNNKENVIKLINDLKNDLNERNILLKK